MTIRIVSQTASIAFAFPMDSFQCSKSTCAFRQEVPHVGFAIIIIKIENILKLCLAIYGYSNSDYGSQASHAWEIRPVSTAVSSSD